MLKVVIRHLFQISIFLIAVFSLLESQTIYSKYIKGMRIEGVADAKFPLTLLNSNPVTISFDVDQPASENYFIRVLHCDKNWNLTRSTFINDEFRNFSRNQIRFEVAPNGVSTYKWTYSLRIPETGGQQSNSVQGMNDFENFRYSGNYKFEIWNINRTEFLAEGKFFVAERISDSALNIYNRYLPSEISPQNQVNKAVFSFTISELSNGNENPIFPNFIKTVDLYRNRQIELPFRIDIDDNDLNTYLDGWGTNDLKFVIDNLQTGNEYRLIDIRSPDYYPPSTILRSRDGADVSRWQQRIVLDNNGTSTLVMNSRYSDYEQFQFELIRSQEKDGEIIYVVGDFNGWKINDEWRLEYDDSIKHYKLKKWIRRGVYDYQYVLNGNDWITIEGNDWRTVNVYTALLYYHDDRFGGFDRILLAAQKRSPGGTDVNSR